MKSLAVSIVLHMVLLYSMVLTNPNKINLENIRNNVQVNMVNISNNEHKITENIKKPNTENKPSQKNFRKKDIEPVKNHKKIQEKIYKKKKIESESIKKENIVPENTEKIKQLKESSDNISKESSDKDQEEKVRINESKNKNISDKIDKNFIQLSDGSIVAINQGVHGLSYNFISKPNPKYPTIAKKLGFHQEIIVKVRLLVNENGDIEEIKFYSEKDKFGFTEEVRKTLNNWKLTPVKMGNKKIKMYFYKSFRFKIKK